MHCVFSIHLKIFFHRLQYTMDDVLHRIFSVHWGMFFVFVSLVYIWKCFSIVSSLYIGKWFLHYDFSLHLKIFSITHWMLFFHCVFSKHLKMFLHFVFSIHWGKIYIGGCFALCPQYTTFEDYFATCLQYTVRGGGELLHSVFSIHLKIFCLQYTFEDVFFILPSVYIWRYFNFSPKYKLNDVLSFLSKVHFGGWFAL